MLPATESFEHRAINRVTFGARDLDVAYAQKIGWAAWVKEQLSPLPGDDPELAAHLQAQRLRMTYAAGNPALRQTWPAVNEVERPLLYLKASAPQLWNLARGSGFSVHPSEVTQVYVELLAATLIRNTHARYQLREVMAEFWFAHFNIGRDKSVISATMTLPYDRDVIRPNVFGNFRTLLEATATSPAMLIYLDNYLSTAGKPNENYAREILELHTLGGGAYLGTAVPDTTRVGVNAPGFTDTDIIEASKAFSGWTLDTGQAFGGVSLKNDGSFLYSPYQHNAGAKMFMGVDLSGLAAEMAQGRAILDIIAAHPSTATFICTKLCRRLFGDTPPQSVIARAKAAWLANLKAPDQIGRVLEAILLGGDEIGTTRPVKLRRPYERMVALFRTTDMVVNACSYLYLLLSPVSDCMGAWQTPDGRPDSNSYWMATGPLLAAINLVFRPAFWPEITTSLMNQTPASASATDKGILDYWIARMIGAEISPATYDVVLNSMRGLNFGPDDKSGAYLSAIEAQLQRVVGLIAASAEFSYR